MDVSRELRVSPPTVTKWRRRFVDDRLEGLSDEPRPGAPRTITDQQVEQVINKTLEEAPPHRDTHWSTRSMAEAAGMSQTAISRIWRAFDLKPHLVQTWKLSTDPEFVGKVRDVVGLYLDPPENALVLCVDEKSQMQAIDRTAPILPVMPTTPARMTHDYVRNGTTSLFAALDVATGTVISQLWPLEQTRRGRRNRGRPRRPCSVHNGPSNPRAIAPGSPSTSPERCGGTTCSGTISATTSRSTIAGCVRCSPRAPGADSGNGAPPPARIPEPGGRQPARAASACSISGVSRFLFR